MSEFKIVALIEDEEVVPPSKIVKYHGHSFKVPNWVEYMTTDKDGCICYYSDIPYIDYEFNSFSCSEGKCDCVPDVMAQFEGDWKKSMMSFE